LELAVINPGDVFGPVLNREQHKSAQTLLSIMGKGAVGVARVAMPLVDVRDVAAAHLAAMTAPGAAGQRFCCLAGIHWMREIALILQRHYAGRGYRIVTREWPDVIVHLVGLFAPGIWSIEPRLGQRFAVSNERIKAVLGWQPRTPEEAVFSMAESLVQLGMNSGGRP
jgi:dihydroflavonol-4-reductase